MSRYHTQDEVYFDATEAELNDRDEERDEIEDREVQARYTSDLRWASKPIGGGV
jgi:hypothetical protein